MSPPPGEPDFLTSDPDLSLADCHLEYLSIRVTRFVRLYDVEIK